jgi:hypothetical protein
VCNARFYDCDGLLTPVQDLVHAAVRIGDDAHRVDVVGLDTDRHQDLADAHPGGCAVRFAIGTAHAGLQAIRASARKHLVDAQHRERVHAHPDVVSLLASVLDEVLVAGHTRCLECLRADVLLLPTAHTRLAL